MHFIVQASDLRLLRHCSIVPSLQRRKIYSCVIAVENKCTAFQSVADPWPILYQNFYSTLSSKLDPATKSGISSSSSSPSFFSPSAFCIDW
jgi:hypothetical protein